VSELLRLTRVGKRYGLRGPWVLGEVDLKIAAGTLVLIEGRNGSGKSTLLRLAAGLGRPSTGRVSGTGRRAYVPERFAAALPFDALGYLAHVAAAHGLPAAVGRARATAWLDRLGGGSWTGVPLKALSKGTAQKVAVAQALLAEPDLLVLDEARTGLDAAARKVLDAAVDERLAAGGAVLVVDHSSDRPLGPGDVRLTLKANRLAPIPDDFPARDVEIRVEDPVTGQQLVQATEATSDAVLRELLAQPGLHVQSVRTVQG
jgi:ABC-type multidrug transport system ATPase subunit